MSVHAVIRPMRPADLPALLRIQAACYPPSMNEPEAVLRQRLDVAADTAWVTETPDGVHAYLFAYRSRLGKLTPLGGGFRVEPDGDSLYLHDLAVGPALKGRGVGPALVERALQQAAELRLPWSSLIAVQGSLPFWSRLGYRPFTRLTAEQAAHLRGYDGEAHYLARAIAVD